MAGEVRGDKDVNQRTAASNERKVRRRNRQHRSDEIWANRDYNCEMTNIENVAEVEEVNPLPSESPGGMRKGHKDVPFFFVVWQRR